MERLHWTKPAQQQDYYARAERAEQEAQRKASLSAGSNQLISHELFNETLDFNVTTSFARDIFNANVLNSVASGIQSRQELHDNTLHIFSDSKHDLNLAVEKANLIHRTNVGPPFSANSRN